jgi:anthranilate synthase component 1
MKESEMPNTAPLPPMASGLFGYLGYDMIRHVEKVPDNNPDLLGVFDTVLMRPSVIAIFDRLKDSITLAVPIRPASWASATEAWNDAQARLDETEERLYDAIPHSYEQPADTPDIIPQSNVSRNRFYEMVKKARDYITAGDIFQVVLSQRFSFPFTLPTFTFYRSLRRLNPSPFLFHFALGDVSIVGSSPEILVRLRGGEVTIRPIAGTRPRGATPEEDAAHAAELMADVKERSEHLMLLDLGRNDVGRVSKPGSVRVISNFEVEYYSHVMHIASEVRGQIRDECDVIDALIAGFPAGTVSGAPKIRAMEIIDELEPDRRGIYAGAVGYISAAGELDSCIALRTAVIKDGVMHVQAGAGIVYDSQEKSEFDECHNKARALIRAAMDASQFTPSNRR